jgi:glycosyltransferase involved in cell wall biosynthesis
MKNRKVAIVYDWIDKWGGVERLLLTLHELYPEAEFYTSYYDKRKATWAKDLTIKTSFIQKLPDIIKCNRVLSLFLYPYAFESFNLSEYDLVISVTSLFAKGVITKPQTKHVCILLTPPRYIWGDSSAYTHKNIFIALAKKIFGNYFKKWDYIAAQRVDEFISISKLVAKRCKLYYGRESTVIYPPFDVEYWEKAKKNMEKNVPHLPNDPFYLVVGRIEPYKRLDLVLDAFKKFRDKKLVVVGTGSEEDVFKKQAGENVTFMKNLTDKQLAFVYSHAKVLIMPQEEEFGYVALEAQFFGCPVISYQKSGAAETVLNGKTGLFFPEQSADALAKKLVEFDIISYKLKESCLEHGPKNVKKFLKPQFMINLSIY